MSVPDHFFDVFEAAEIAGVTHETIRLRIKAGDLTEYRVKNRALRVDPSELAAVEWIRRPFWSWVIEDEAGCWVWQGRLNKGYGSWSGGLAHRFAYEELVAEIPDGLDLDHLCRNPPCINPWHLEPVTRLVNVQRHYAYQTHCKQGHEFTPENTYMKDARYRQCRKCTAAAQRRYYARKRAG